MADKTKSSSVAAASGRRQLRFAVRISGEMEAESVPDAFARIAAHFAARAERARLKDRTIEVPPLTDGICRVTPVDDGG